MGAPSVKQGSGRFIAGDPLRGIACLVVLFWHTAVSGADIVPPYGVSPGLEQELGAIGPPVVTLAISVWFFFLLSGYLISGPFVRAVVRGDGRKPRVGAYVRNRILRIVPGFWALLTITLIVVGPMGNSLRQMLEFYGFAHVYDQGPFTPRMVQAWTLDVEVIFYAAIPLLLLPLANLLRGRGTPWFRAGFILAGCLAVAIASLAIGTRGPASGLCVPGSMWAFTPGIALATIEPLVRDRLQGRALGRHLARALMLTSLGAALLYTYAIDPFSTRLLNVIALVSCGCLLAGPLVLQWTTGRAWQLLDNRVLHWFGVRAYGIYLAHVLVIYELAGLTRSLGSVKLDLLVVFPLVLSISTIAGALSFRFIERPFLERRLPWRRGEAPPVNDPAAPVPTPAVQPVQV
jgi:peptidoglycan/LPS O-acetylase OafA/YrhL